jgi:hypothetical protein
MKKPTKTLTAVSLMLNLMLLFFSSRGLAAPLAPPQPDWCCATASEILNIGSQYNPEYIARWSLSNAYNAHYSGPGGDQATCDYPVNHKCIWTWNWTNHGGLTHNALLLPTLGWMWFGPPEAWTPSNYYASIWS